jgi:membrane protease YdiL (CAAX protease family)
VSARRSTPGAGPSPERPSLTRRLGAWLPDPPADATTPDHRTTFVLVLATLLLVVFQYFGKPESYRGGLAARLQPVASAWLGPHADMAPFVHWGLSSIVLRVPVPFAVIAFVFREPLANYGWRWRGTLAHAPLYAGLYVLMLPLIVWASTQASFQQKYPFFRGAAEGGVDFWGYELAYGAQFAGVEFFFRGFLTFALFRRFGYTALLIMAIPYVMVHFNKPLPETLGAFGAGLILGALALRAKSCVPGIFLHWAVGMTMDVLAIGKSLGSLGAAFRAIF